MCDVTWCCDDVTRCRDDVTRCRDDITCYHKEIIYPELAITNANADSNQNGLNTKNLTNCSYNFGIFVLTNIYVSRVFK